MCYIDTHKTLKQIGQELRGWLDGKENTRLEEAFGRWEEGNGISFDMNFADKPFDIIITDGHIDDEVIQSVNDAIATVRVDFPVLDCLKEILFSGEETGFAAARNDGKALRVNTSVFANTRTLKAAFDEVVKIGHTKNAENPMFVIAHELGHILHTQLALKRCGMEEVPLYGGIPAIAYRQSRQQIIVDLFEHSIFTNESASEIYRAIWEEMGARSRDSNDEMLAQAFGMHYYGKGSHPISDSFVKYMMQEFRR